MFIEKTTHSYISDSEIGVYPFGTMNKTMSYQEVPKIFKKSGIRNFSWNQFTS